MQHLKSDYLLLSTSCDAVSPHQGLQAGPDEAFVYIFQLALSATFTFPKKALKMSSNFENWDP